jgi:hypothetical protein
MTENKLIRDVVIWWAIAAPILVAGTLDRVPASEKSWQSSVLIGLVLSPFVAVIVAALMRGAVEWNVDGFTVDSPVIRNHRLFAILLGLSLSSGLGIWGAVSGNLGLGLSGIAMGVSLAAGIEFYAVIEAYREVEGQGVGKLEMVNLQAADG